jgi:hypothetical protein
MFNIKFLYYWWQVSSDEEVPFTENGQIRLDKSKELNANVKLILKKGCGHHPHSPENVQSIVKFLEM